MYIDPPFIPRLPGPGDPGFGPGSNQGISIELHRLQNEALPLPQLLRGEAQHEAAVGNGRQHQAGIWTHLLGSGWVDSVYPAW